MRVRSTHGWGACARRIAPVASLADTFGYRRAPRRTAAWRMPSPHAPLTHIKPLADGLANGRTIGAHASGDEPCILR